MFNRILKEMRDKIRRLEYIMTIHAEEEMNDDCATIFDVERCILTGKILERQKDKDTAAWKYRINGESLPGGAPLILRKTECPHSTLRVSGGDLHCIPGTFPRGEKNYPDRQEVAYLFFLGYYKGD